MNWIIRTRVIVHFIKYKVLLYFFFQDPTCETKDGKMCVFPFKYMGTGLTYYSCTTDIGNWQPWCATRVDAKGMMVPGFPPSWDYCKRGKACKLG